MMTIALGDNDSSGLDADGDRALVLTLIMGLSTRDLGSGSDADRGSGFKDHFASTRPRSGSELRAVLRDSAPGQCVRSSPAVQCA